MQLVGWLLVGALLVSAVAGLAGSARGYNGAFWRLPLDDKLDFVHTHRRDWWWMAGLDLTAMFAVTAGTLGITYLLAEAGRPLVAYVGFGGYLVAMAAWVFGLVTQAAMVPRAATQRFESGGTPAWIQGLWDAAYLAEGVWVIGANLAYVIIGVALLQSDLVAAWAGWAAIGVGAAIAVTVVLVRDGFPQLSLIVPLVVGIALLVD